MSTTRKSAFRLDEKCYDRLYLGDRDVRLYVGDSVSVMDELHSQHGYQADLVFGDPPFNIGRVGYDPKVHDRKDVAVYAKFTSQWITAAARLLTATGSLVVNCFDNFAADVVNVAIRESGLHLARWIIWHYRFGQNQPDNFIQSKQHVLYFTKSSTKFTRNMREILEPSDRASKYGDRRTLDKKEGVAGMRCPFDVWHGEGFSRVQGNNSERWKSKWFEKGHDNQLPERYIRRLILALTNRGDMIFDAFVGSGGFPTVASSLNRRCWGVDLSKRCVLSAYRRVQQGPVTPVDWK